VVVTTDWVHLRALRSLLKGNSVPFRGLTEHERQMFTDLAGAFADGTVEVYETDQPLPYPDMRVLRPPPLPSKAGYFPGPEGNDYKQWADVIMGQPRTLTREVPGGGSVVGRRVVPGNDPAYSLIFKLANTPGGTRVMAEGVEVASVVPTGTNNYLVEGLDAVGEATGKRAIDTWNGSLAWIAAQLKDLLEGASTGPPCMTCKLPITVSDVFEHVRYRPIGSTDEPTTGWVHMPECAVPGMTRA
jgi:hypothetical protein